MRERIKKGWHALRHPAQKEPDVIEDANVQVFGSVGWVDKKLLWAFEMVSSLAVLLLAFGLVTSQTNVQTHGAVLTNVPWMQDVWAWTQNIAIDMSLLGAIVRSAVYGLERERGKAILYGLLALLLLFTAFIVSDVEAIYQSVQGLTLDTAWGHLPFVSVEMLTSIRSFAIVLLLVAHAVQYVNWYRAKYRARKQQGKQEGIQTAPAAQVVTAQETKESDIEKVIQAMQSMNQQNLAAMQSMMQQGIQVTVERAMRVTVEAMRETVASLPVYSPAQIAQPEQEVNGLEVGGKPSRGKQEGKQIDYGPLIDALYQKNADITTTDIEKELGCTRKTASKHLQRLRPVMVSEETEKE